MINQVKITSKLMMVNFEFPMVVGQTKLTAVGQAFINKDNNTDKLQGDFEFMDHTDVTYMNMPIDGYEGWKKLKHMHSELGIDLDKLIGDEFNKVVTKDFKKQLLKQFDANLF